MPETNHHIDDQILEDSVRELMRNSKEDYSHVDISVDAHQVHFTGTLESERARKHLEELAGMVSEIGMVINDVTLKH